MLKRGMIVLALLLAAALALGSCALAEGEWTCPSCGQLSGGNFCSNCGARKPESSGDYLLSWNGFTVALVDMKTDMFSSGSVHLYIDVHVVNGTDREVWLDADDVTINGVPVTGSGKPGITVGEELDLTLSFWPNLEQSAEGMNAICNPDTITMYLNLKDSNDYEDLYGETVTLSLASLPSMTPMPTVNAPDPTPAPTQGRGISALINQYRTPKPAYTALVKGDRGEAVRRMQLELIRLGYLGGSADGIFGNQTLDAVREFARTNGLTSNDIATPELQELLFSGSAKAYQEPYVPLVIPSPSNGQWKKASGNKISFRFQVTNKSRTHTIKTFEVRVYALNVWGERIYGERTYYYGTTNKRVEPGKTVYCDYLTMPNRSEVDRLYACVSRVVFTDGTIRENPETNDYNDYWVLGN